MECGAEFAGIVDHEGFIMDLNHSPFEDFESFIIEVYRNEPQAWEVLVREYGKTIKKYMLSKFIREDIAEDIIQQVYERLFKAINHKEGTVPHFDNPQGLLNYMRKIAVGCAADEIKQSFPHFSLEQVPEGKMRCLGDLITDSILKNPEIAKQYDKAIENCIKNLKSKIHKEIVSLFFHEQITAREIAEKIEMPYENVRKIVYRAKRKLRHNLSEISESD